MTALQGYQAKLDIRGPRGQTKITSLSTGKQCLRWGDSKSSLHHARNYTSSTWRNPRPGASHKSMPVSCLLLILTRNPSCLTNQSLYTVHSASFSAISISKRSTSSGMSLFISMSDMFLPRQVRGPRPNCSRQYLLASFVLLASFLFPRE